MLKLLPAEMFIGNDDAPPAFVAVIDGSATGLRALGPALALAEWFKRPCHIVEVNGGEDDRDTSFAVALQLEDFGIEERKVFVVAKRDLGQALAEIAHGGHTIVTSAYGSWAVDARLVGALGELVRNNLPTVIGIGPNVPSDWRPQASSPVLVCVDASEHAHHIAAKVGQFIVPDQTEVIVAHVEVEDPPDSSVARGVASEIRVRWGAQVTHTSVRDDSATASIATLAARRESQLVITHSWHRPRVGQPVIASTSLSTVAHAPCPVVILCDAD